MIDVIPIVRERLIAITGVVSAVGARVYPNYIPDHQLPAVTIRQSGFTREPMLGGLSTKETIKVQISCKSTSRLEALAIANAAEGTWDEAGDSPTGLNGWTATDGVTIVSACEMTDASEDAEYVDDGSGHIAIVAIREFEIVAEKA